MNFELVEGEVVLTMNFAEGEWRLRTPLLSVPANARSGVV